MVDIEKRWVSSAESPVLPVRARYPVDPTLSRLCRPDVNHWKIVEFLRLFANCSDDRIMTRKSFEDHSCCPARVKSRLTHDLTAHLANCTQRIKDLK